MVSYGQSIIACGRAESQDRRTGDGMVRFLKRLWKAEQGQDLVEYALIAATLVVVVAGFLPPTIMPSVSTIFSKIVSGFALI